MHQSYIIHHTSHCIFQAASCKLQAARYLVPGPGPFYLYLLCFLFAVFCLVGHELTFTPPSLALTRIQSAEGPASASSVTEMPVDCPRPRRACLPWFFVFVVVFVNAIKYQMELAVWSSPDDLQIPTLGTENIEGFCKVGHIMVRLAAYKFEGVNVSSRWVTTAGRRASVFSPPEDIATSKFQNHPGRFCCFVQAPSCESSCECRWGLHGHQGPQSQHWWLTGS